MQRVLLLATSVVFAAVGQAQDMAIVELPGSTLSTDDGFRARIEASATTQKAPRGRMYSACIFDIYVPRHVGKTHVGSAFLELTGRDGRTVTEVAMDDRASRGEPPHFYIFADRRAVGDCVLH